MRPRPYGAALLPHQAVSTCDAIVRVIYRRTVSHRLMLEWQTAQEAHRVSTNLRSQFLGRLGWISLGTLSVEALLLMAFPLAQRAAAPFLTLWFFAPLLVLWTNSTTQTSASPELQDADRRMLRQLARETWRFFSEFVGPASNWLPPDNYQESLRIEVAQRTSPTNIGLSLMSPLAAHDFGWLTLDEVDDRTLATLMTMERLEKYEGHFLNWYDSKVPNMAQLDAEILTDCVFALRSDPPGQEEYLLRLMKANWPQIEEAYGGSCAPYLTQDRLQALLLSWGVASAIVSAMRTKRSSNLARDYAVGCPSPSTARSS